MNEYGEDSGDFQAPSVRPGASLTPLNATQVQPMNVATSQLAIQEKMAEIQMRYISARQFPRDIVRVENQIRLACGRYGMAQMAQYALPVAGSKVRGPSIRLAEVLAQCFGNLDVGKEVVATGKDNEGYYSDLKVYCLDLESGSRFQEVIRVYHMRVSKKDGTVVKQPLTDQGELERLFSMQAAKRLRECIFKTIPRDLTEKALAWCAETVRAGEKDASGKAIKPLIERVKGMVLEFERIGVKREQLEKNVGCAIDFWTPEHFEEMLSTFRSIRDGHASADEFFGDPNATGAGDTAAKMRAQAAARQKPPTQAAEGAKP